MLLHLPFKIFPNNLSLIGPQIIFTVTEGMLSQNTSKKLSKTLKGKHEDDVEIDDADDNHNLDISLVKCVFDFEFDVLKLSIHAGSFQVAFWKNL